MRQHFARCYVRPARSSARVNHTTTRETKRWEHQVQRDPPHQRTQDVKPTHEQHISNTIATRHQRTQDVNGRAVQMGRAISRTQVASYRRTWTHDRDAHERETDRQQTARGKKSKQVMSEKSKQVMSGTSYFSFYFFLRGKKSKEVLSGTSSLDAMQAFAGGQILGQRYVNDKVEWS